ncbi:diaminopimelate epimerase [uncultured Ilyobacter sp.]|jgi:diaminopimelate epimerase|uniref:diaminopimelate epimerase n=1 Tax=uncultured Ilyobacter sp. TaxID=544433 RepID=UPI0029C0961B|nr:diaminopimelate epimerase [uncultured Ilyobacter sp.]
MLKFEKYHGIGNDFIIFREEEVEGLDYSELAMKVCHRNFGIGADGMMVAAKSEKADIRMIFYNADGSEAPMCGNGVRCFSHFVRNNELVEKDLISVETLAGNMLIKTEEKDGRYLARVNMGMPIFETESIPMSVSEKDYIERKIESYEREFSISALFMGTTHSVTFVDDLETLDIYKYGRNLEINPIFPNKTNVNFAKVISKDRVDVKTWERGAGYTFACGTGACAVVVIGNLTGRLDKNVEVAVPGGKLFIELTDEGVFMTGESQKIAEGHYFK